MQNDTERWPAAVYGEGEEPDYRYSLANERTFLAWLRTSLALIAAGVAVSVIEFGTGSSSAQVLSGTLLGSGVMCPMLAFWRWAASERAMRLNGRLPQVGAVVAVSGALVLTAAALAVGALLS